MISGNTPASTDHSSTVPITGENLLHHLEEIKKDITNQIASLSNLINESTKDEQKTIERLDTYLNHIKDVVYLRPSPLLKRSYDQIIEIKRWLLHPFTIKMMFIGVAGSGKTSFLNKGFGFELLPASDNYGRHVTQCIVEVTHGPDYQTQVYFVEEEQFKSRISQLKLEEEKAKYKFESREAITRKFTDKNHLVEFINDFNGSLTQNDIMLVEKLAVTIPSMQERLTMVDTPGVGNTNSEIFQILALEAAKTCDTICHFGIGRRYMGLPEDMQIFIGMVSDDGKVQTCPPSFKYISGGVNMGESADCFLKAMQDKMEIHDQFKQMIAQEFDYLVDKDTIPKETYGNHCLLVDIKEFCDSLINNFDTVFLPHFKSDHYMLCEEIAMKNLTLQVTKEEMKKLELTKVKIRDHITSLIPLLNIAAKSTVEKKKEKSLIEIEKLEKCLMEKMKEIISTFPRIVESTIDEKLSLNSITKVFKELVTALEKKEFKKIVNNCMIALESPVSPKNENKKRVHSETKKHDKTKKIVLKSVLCLIDSCKNLLKNKGKEWSNLPHHPQDKEDTMNLLLKDVKEMSDHFQTIFDPNNEYRFVLAPKIKKELNIIFKSYQSKVNFEFEYNLDTPYQVPKRDTNGLLRYVDKIPVPVEQNSTAPPRDSTSLQYAALVQSKMIAAKDYCNTNDIGQHPLSTISIVLTKTPPPDQQPPVNNFDDEQALPAQIEAPECLIPTVLIDQDLKTVTFRDPPEIDNISDFQDLMPKPSTQSRVHPIFIIATNGEMQDVVPNLLLTSLYSEGVKNQIPHLIFVVTIDKHVSYYKSLINNRSNYHIISIDNSKKTLRLSMPFMETICFMLSTQHFNFKVITIFNENVGKIYEYIPKLKKLKSEKITPLRYFHFVESLVYHEISLKAEEILHNLTKMFDRDFTMKMFDTNNVDIVQAGCKTHALNPTELITRLRHIDEEHNTDYERKCIEALFSQGRGKFCLKTKIEDNRIHNHQKTNYVLGQCHEEVATYFLPALKGIYPLSDDKFFAKSTREIKQFPRNSVEASAPFRATMLFHGVSSYFCYSFCFMKNYNEDIEEVDDGNDDQYYSDTSTEEFSRPRKMHKRAPNKE